MKESQNSCKKRTIPQGVRIRAAPGMGTNFRLEYFFDNLESTVFLLMKSHESSPCSSRL